MHFRYFHTATASNSLQNRTAIQALSGHDAERFRLFAVNFSGPRHPMAKPDEPHILNPSLVGTQFVRELGCWSIVNLSGAPIPLGAKFDIIGENVASAPTFVHETTRGNISGNFSVLPIRGTSTRADHIFVSPRLRPRDLWTSEAMVKSPFHRDAFPAYDLQPENLAPQLRDWVRPYHESQWNHPLGVWYNEGLGIWTVVNLDGAPMERGLLFNVMDVTRIHGSGLTMHYGTFVSNEALGAPQIFCLTPCEAGGMGFCVTVNMSWHYQGNNLLFDSIRNRATPARRCLSPVAVGVDPRLYPDSNNASVEQRTFIYYSDGFSVPAGVGFNIYHNATEYGLF